MSTYEYEYDGEFEFEDEFEYEYDEYNDSDGYEVFHRDENDIGYWFKTYTEMRDTFDVIWDYEEEMYILQEEEVEADEEFVAFLDSCVNEVITEMAEHNNYTTNEL